MIKAELDELPPDTLRLETMANLTSYVDAILLCTKHQKIITDDVLTLSKLEFEKVSLASLPFTPSLLVDPILKMFSAELQTKHLTVHKSFKNCDMILLADSNRLNQILINLIANVSVFVILLTM
jgi:signal transduction histidine kinase